MSVLPEENGRHLRHPMPFLLHDSLMHRARCLRDVSEYCNSMHSTDADLSARIMVTRRAGIVLYGAPIRDVFAVPTKREYIEGILCDTSSAENDISDMPEYRVLNLCRALVYLRTDMVMGKRQGGEWGRENLARYGKIIDFALSRYTGIERTKPTDTKLCRFAKEMLRRIEDKGGNHAADRIF